MIAVFVLLALSAATGFAIGTSLMWLAIVISGSILAMLSAAVLQIAGFGAVAGIGIIVACLMVNQAAYLMGLMRRDWLTHEQSDEGPRDSRGYEIARKNEQEQTARSRFA
jgi:hypothetical protein